MAKKKTAKKKATKKKEKKRRAAGNKVADVVRVSEEIREFMKVGKEVVPGIRMRCICRGHKGPIRRITWSPCGRFIASPSSDKTIRIWDANDGKCLEVLKGHKEAVNAAAWSTDGKCLASATQDGELHLWDLVIGQEDAQVNVAKERVLQLGHPGRGFAWDPNSQRLAVGTCKDGIIRFVDRSTLHSSDVNRSKTGGRHTDIKWSPNGEYLAVSRSFGVSVVNIESGEFHWSISGFDTSLNSNSVEWKSDGHEIVVACENGQIHVREADFGEMRFAVEGHTDSILDISMSPTGELLASKSLDSSVRLWRTDNWTEVARIDETTQGWSLARRDCGPGIAFSPLNSKLATLGGDDRIIRIWELDYSVLLGKEPVLRTVQYTNAKVVLVGESGVGKTGLGYRLAEGVWKETGSTHGMNVWLLHGEEGREVMLWDFAGQSEYRLVHQLFLNETNVALMLYDPTKSDDTFLGIEYWEKALARAVRGDLQKLVVAARIDVGDVRMTAEDIKAYCRERGYLGHYATSAREGKGCEELKGAILSAIAWDKLPTTSSPEVFKQIKEFLAAKKKEKYVLIREPELLEEFRTHVGDGMASEAEFRTVVGHVENAGLIKKLSFGDFVLLKPELLNGVASDIIDAARRHSAGLGAVSKAKVLNGDIPIKGDSKLAKADKVFLLHATAELFLGLGLALEQDGNLVFPSKFNRKMPLLEHDPVVEVEFSFEGPVENIYTTLVVKLYYGGVFRLRQLWKNAAEFVNGRGQICGIQLQSKGDGQGMLKVFYARDVSDDDKALFLKIIADHFAEKEIEVERRRIYRCLNPDCRELVRDCNAVHKALKGGVKELPCLYCFKPIKLIDALEVLYRDEEKFLSQIEEMETTAVAGMERDSELVSATAQIKTESFREWAGGADIATVAIVFTDVVDSTKLNVESGDEPWRRVREAHFGRAKALIKKGDGYLVKTIGDAVMCAFHNARDALDFALGLSDDTGHELVKIRAGIHIGAAEIKSGDAFGQHVTMASRIEGKAKEGGVWVSAKVKEDIDVLGTSKYDELKWKAHPNLKLKGFPNRYKLWSIEER